MQPNRSTHSTINAVEGMVEREYPSKHTLQHRCAWRMQVVDLQQFEVF